MNFYSCQCPHGCLYGFGIIKVGRVGRAEYMFDAEPVGYTDNRTQIARILHAVEPETELVFQEMFRCPSGWALTE